jgi:UDP:flavonoid glycosyltransferase YjiC (YdhE family)
MKRHFILTPFGSAGDVNPFLWIGRLLLERGHDVTLIAPVLFAQAARNARVPFVPVGTLESYERTMRNPKLWHPWHGMQITLRFAGGLTGDYYDAIAATRETTRDEVVLVSSFMALGARVAREKFRVPLATVHVQPAIFLSVHDTPVMRAHMEWFGRMPRWLKRLLFALPNPLDQCAGKSVRGVCAAVGVTPPRSLAREWLHSPDAVLGLFPAWFAPPQPDWPPRCHLAGFPLYDGSDVHELPAEVQRFLAGGSPPIVFTAGSAMLHARDFFATALAACRRLNRRAIFATGHPGQLPPALPPEVLPVSYVPFSRLLPRTAALVHHGGIGTLSHALAAGLPQLVMPMAHDQPDNAQRLVRLGVGRRLYPKAFNADNVTTALRELLSDTVVRKNCDVAAARMRGNRPAEIVTPLLESVRRVGTPDDAPAPVRPTSTQPATRMSAPASRGSTIEEFK